MAESASEGRYLAEERSGEAATDTIVAVRLTRHPMPTAAYVISIGLLVAVLVTVWQSVNQGGSLKEYEPGRDYATFHVTAVLVAEGNGADIYDENLLGARIAEITGYEGITTQPYGHPPFFPLYFLLLSALPFGIAYAVFTGAGAMALGIAVRRVGLKRVVPVLVMVALGFAGFWTLLLGQMGIWASAALLGVYLLLRSERQFSAGLLLGVLVFKPAYVVGIGVWWLLYPRRHLAAIAGAACSSLTIGLLGLLVPEGWANYRSLVDDSGSTLVMLVTRTGYSVLEMFLSVLGSSALATILWLGASVAAVVTFRWLVERFGRHLDLAFAAAVVLGLIISPRVGWYDWVLLVVPAVLLWQGFPHLRGQLVAAGGWLFLTSALSWSLASGLDKSLGFFIQPASVVLIAVTAWWLRQAMHPPQTQTGSAAS